MAELQSLGKYEIRREIGRGAMGVVYEGYDPVIKRKVALKTIRADPLTGEASAAIVARFRREAQAAGRLNHPNVVAIYDFGEDGPVSFIAMEYVQGQELKEHFEANERFRTADAVRIMGEILSALDYSHRQGVVHRDIKPANIFLLPDGTVKVADFGIAHIESSNLTQVGTVLGTPSYMSPEQIMGLPIDGRSDLFSAGVILYQFLTGERPFAGSATTTMQKVLKEDPLPPSLLNVQVAPAMDAVVRKALAKHADDRFQSAREFADALRAAAVAAPATGTDAMPQAEAKAPAAPATASNLEATIIATRQETGAASATATVSTTTPSTPASATMKAPGEAGAARSAVAATSPVVAKRGIPAVAVVAIVAAIAIGAGAWLFFQRQAGETARLASAPSASTAGTASGPTTASGSMPPGAQAGAAPATSGASAAPAPAATTPPQEPGTLLVSAVGLADPSDPRYRSDPALLQADLRADSRSEAVAKALGLLLDADSFSRNYALLRERLLSQSGSYVKTVVREGAAQTGRDGLASITTDAIVNVKALQQSLNQMTRDERVGLIRASGDPKVSVFVAVRDADAPDTPPQPSAVAENILKERIKSFGFRTWAEGAPEGKAGADFSVVGEAKIKRLSARLAASGLVVTKFALTSWTVKCIDRASGEEIYYDTTLPKGLGSWASEEEALKAIGASIAERFSREFFLQHVSVSGQKVLLVVEGLPDAKTEEALARELVGLPSVIAVASRSQGGVRAFDVQLAGSGPPGDRVASGVLKPLNAKLGRPCFSLGALSESQVSVAFDKGCADAAVLSRLETYPPAALYGAPPERQRAVVKNPETLSKLAI